MQNALEVVELDKKFGALHAVQGVSFAVRRGEVLGFLGPNGAGKSTTMKMITGFLEPSAGTVRVLGKDVREHPLAVKRAIGYLPEGAPGYGEMSTRAFLGFIAEIRGLRGQRARRRIDEVAGRIHLETVMDRPIETLSKGFRRRVGMAQAILHDPDVLIMDEPTDGLDPNQKHEVRGLIEEMAPDKAIVVSTHILEEVDAVCSRAVIIAGGQLKFDGTPAELEARSRLHNAVSLQLPEAEAGQARAALEALEQVAAVEQTDGPGLVRLTALPRAGSSIITAVGELARGRGWPVGELRLEQGRLDEVFRNITTAGAGART